MGGEEREQERAREVCVLESRSLGVRFGSCFESLKIKKSLMIAIILIKVHSINICYSH